MDEYAGPYQPFPPQPPMPQPPAGPPEAPAVRRRYLPYLLGFGAVVIAAAGYVAGSAHAHRAAPAAALSAGSALNAAATSPSASPAPASGCQSNRRAVAGTLKAVNDTSFTVGLRNGTTVTVHTSSTTTIRKAEMGALSDIKDGATVAVRGTSSGQNAIAASQVDLVDRAVKPAPSTGGPTTPGPGSTNRPVPPRLAGVALGTVSNMTGSGFTVTEGNGTKVTVTTTTSTKVTKTVAASLNQLTTGQPVAAGGTANSDGSIAATQVAQGQAGLGPWPGGFPGPGAFPGPGRGFFGRPGSGGAGAGSSPPSSVA
jgi:hypothetical protein